MLFLVGVLAHGFPSALFRAARVPCASRRCQRGTGVPDFGRSGFIQTVFFSFVCHSIAFFPPLAGRVHFLCPAKENEPKERRPDGLRAAPVPCASRRFARSPNSQHFRERGNRPFPEILLKQGARFPANRLRCSAVPTGPGAIRIVRSCNKRCGFLQARIHTGGVLFRLPAIP